MMGHAQLMASAEEYRRHAAECLSLAQIAESTEDKTRLLDMAEAWRALAERLMVNTEGDHRK
jgi:hypothetical protein